MTRFAVLVILATVLALVPSVGWAADDNDNNEQRKNKDEQTDRQRAALGRPDLQIEYAGSSVPGAGEQLVTFRVSNIGTVRSTAVSVRVVTLEPEPTPLQRELDVASLAPGVSAEVVYPVAAACNGHRVLAAIDDPLDSQPTNNRAEVRICPPGAPRPDIIRLPGANGDRPSEHLITFEQVSPPPGTVIACCVEAETPTAVHTAAQTVRPGITSKDPIIAGGRAVYAEAGATGDGPADQAECDKWASAINTGVNQLNTAIDDGDGDRAIAWADEIEHLEQKAMDRGCFVVH
jgi:hypothetical protein